MLVEQTDIKQQFLEGLPHSVIFSPERVEQALAEIQLLGFPAGKDEFWKYTRPTKIINSRFTASRHTRVPDLEGMLIPDLDATVIVFVNGYLSPAQSNLHPQDDAVEINNREVVFTEGPQRPPSQIFTAINTAYSTGGLAIRVKKGQNVAKPIHIIHVQTTDDTIAQPRHLIVSEENSGLKVIMSYHGTVSGRTFTNAVNEYFVARNGRLEVSKVQHEHDEALHIASDHAWQDRDSFFSINTITLTGALVRNNISIAIDGENCESRLFGLYHLSGHQHVDNHTLVDHRQPHCLSNELYKGIIGGNAVGVFNGKVFVRQDAQKTNAFQQNNNILMSDAAVMNTKPELEIYADDVKCSHGCTIGQFDEEALFYLRSRGIGEAAAKNLMVYAFAAEVLDNISIPELHAQVSSFLSSRLSGQ